MSWSRVLSISDCMGVEEKLDMVVYTQHSRTPESEAEDLNLRPVWAMRLCLSPGMGVRIGVGVKLENTGQIFRLSMDRVQNIPGGLLSQQQNN